MLYRTCFFILIFLSFSAWSVEVYNVKNIKISASDKNAKLARDLALEKGQLKAFQILVKQHYPKALEAALSLDDPDIIDLVVSFQLSEERRSTTNYFAKLDVKFNRDQTDKLMHKLGASFDSTNIQPLNEKSENSKINLPANLTSPTLTTLLVPIFEQYDRTYWFDEENTWLNFWQNRLHSSSKFILPVGDLEDIKLLNKHISNKNIIDLDPLLSRYNADNIAIVKLSSLENHPTAHFSLQLNYINKYHPAWQKQSFADLEGDKANDLFKKAAGEIEQFNFRSSQGYLSNNNSFAITEPHNISIDYSIEKLSDWVDLEKILTTTSYVNKLTLHTINSYQYQFSLTYNISFVDLQALLKSYNFTLQERGENKFLLMRNVPSAEY
jgi:hypothetical protein